MRDEIIEKAKKKYESLRGKGYTKPESLQLIAGQLGKSPRTLYKWHEDGGWDEIDEKIDAMHLEELEKLPDHHRRAEAAYIVVNKLLQRAYSRIREDGARIVVRGYYDFYGLLNAYLALAGAGDDPRLESHKRFLGEAIKEILGDPELKDRVLPIRGKEIEHAVKRLIKYLEVARWEKEPSTDWTKYILHILERIEDEASG